MSCKEKSFFATRPPTVCKPARSNSACLPVKKVLLFLGLFVLHTVLALSSGENDSGWRSSRPIQGKCCKATLMVFLRPLFSCITSTQDSTVLVVKNSFKKRSLQTEFFDWWRPNWATWTVAFDSPHNSEGVCMFGYWFGWVLRAKIVAKYYINGDT